MRTNLNQLRHFIYGSPKRLFAIAVLLCLIALAVVNSQKLQHAEAACPTPTTSYGTVTSTVNVPATGNYVVWSRMMAPNTTDDTYTFEMDGTRCGIVVGGNGISTTAWTWTKKNSAGADIVLNNLTAGNHTIVMTGTAPNVKLDRVILTTDTGCTPTGVGDNCTPPPDTTPPVVDITSPAPNTTIRTTTTVTATASDASGIRQVQFFLGYVPIGSPDTTAPYSINIDPATLNPGTYALHAQATDNNDNVTDTGNQNLIIADINAPTNVVVTSPTAGSTKSGTIQLCSTAQDNVGVTKVEYYFDNDVSPRTTDTTPPSPFCVSFDTNTLTNATHTVKAKAFDAANNTTLSAAVSFTVNNQPAPDTENPTVSVSRPAAGESITTDSYTLSAVATDNVGVTRVEFFVDGQLKSPADTSAPFTYNLDVTGLANGIHTFSAKAYDAAGNNATSANVTASVNRQTFLDEDINQSGCVDLIDFAMWKAKNGQTVPAGTREDITHDLIVDLRDFGAWKAKNGQCTT